MKLNTQSKTKNEFYYPLGNDMLRQQLSQTQPGRPRTRNTEGWEFLRLHLEDHDEADNTTQGQPIKIQLDSIQFNSTLFMINPLGNNMHRQQLSDTEPRRPRRLKDGSF
jgi:hypothetical protein